MSHAMNVGPLDDPYIGAIEWGGYVWTDNDVFRAPVTIGYFLENDYSAWTSVESSAIAAAFQSWANVANITFFPTGSAASADLIEHSVPGSVLDGDYGLHGTPEHALSATDRYDGDLLLGGHTYAHGYFNYESFGWDYSNPNGGLSVGGNGYWTLVHELGHGLGLAHPHDNGGGSSIFPGVTDTWVTGENGLNQGIWTVMSYIGTTDPSTANTNYTGDDTWNDSAGNEVGTYGYYAGPMAFDIAAIQDLYGANTTYHNGGDIYYLPDQNAVGTYWTCIWDTGGWDSIAYNGTRNVTINLTAATLDDSATGGGVISSATGIHGGYTIANGVVIEGAYSGSGSDTLVGNSADNILNGGAGADSMTGGGGNDTYYVDNVGDVVHENGGGNDTVVTTLSYYALGANLENLNDLGPPTVSFTGIGNSLNNLIQSYHGDDYLDGGAGADTLQGYNGNDTYVIDNVGDVILESANSGSDWVKVYLTSYTLGANLENLDYIGTSTNSFVGTGNSLDNIIQGWNGSDILNGAAGADTMRGYDGDDSYYVDNTGDMVVENSNAGNDWVYSYLTSYTLGANVENVVYLGTSTNNFTGIGNTLGNYIQGLSGNDTLNGGAGDDTLVGGIGTDSMTGGTGNDTYYVDNPGDTVVENANEGTDTVNTTINLTLGANIENLTMQGSSGLQGYGNTLANTITGNNGSNLLDGAGGADTMIGRGGNDAYVVDNIGDVVTENAGEGADTVYSTIDYRLTANVEYLVLQGGAVQGYGNALSNAIYGTSADNLLDGSTGADSMYGGAGNDSYFLDNISDLVVENGNEGNDTVYSTANFRLSANLEYLVLQGGAVQGYGNALSNALYGTSADNLLDGDAGADSMYGGAGNDSYFLDNIADLVIENLNEGFDTVYSTANYRLSANVECLVLQGGAVQGYGNALSNAIYGTSGNNLLDGDAGGDSMYGGAGNDSYFVDNAGDLVIESANEGIDTVYSSINYRMAANTDILILQGSNSLQGYGNGLANTLYGNTGNNLLDGDAGADKLTGNAGNDVFLFHAGQASGDTVMDFAGNGAAAGDGFQFMGFGTAVQGATFTEIGATNQWQIHSGLDGHNEIITLSNNATVHAQDYLFI